MVFSAHRLSATDGNSSSRSFEPFFLFRLSRDGPVMRNNRAGDRPERLKMRSACEDSGPRLVLIRQPRGPDGTKGFATPRDSWRASALLATTPSSAAAPLATSSEGGSDD